MTDVDLDLLADQLVEWNARLRRVETAIEELDAAAGPGVEVSGNRTDAINPAFDSVEAWVTEHFAPMYGRPLGGEFRWCARWREHAEALSRLEALWRSWETLRHDPAMGMAVWYTSTWTTSCTSCSATADRSAAARLIGTTVAYLFRPGRNLVDTSASGSQQGVVGPAQRASPTRMISSAGACHSLFTM